MVVDGREGISNFGPNSAISPYGRTRIPHTATGRIPFLYKEIAC
jgi:hypothetical protein